MRNILRTVVLALAVLAAPGTVLAQSMSLDQAQKQGLVGERRDGYVGVVKNAPGVQALVDQVNLQRRQIYRDIARKNGIPLNSVEALAGQKAISSARSGEMVQSSSGSWVRK